MICLILFIIFSMVKNKATPGTACAFLAERLRAALQLPLVEAHPHQSFLAFLSQLLSRLLRGAACQFLGAFSPFPVFW